jgi:hypothetical protein
MIRDLNLLKKRYGKYNNYYNKLQNYAGKSYSHILAKVKQEYNFKYEEKLRNNRIQFQIIREDKNTLVNSITKSLKKLEKISSEFKVTTRKYILSVQNSEVVIQ